MALTDSQKESVELNMEPESVFSAPTLPMAFYKDFLAAHACAGVVDLAIGQGEMLRACLQLRIPVYGLALSDLHAKKTEIRLTEWLVQALRLHVVVNFFLLNFDIVVTRV